jgi:hypothetical protein
VNSPIDRNLIPAPVGSPPPPPPPPSGLFTNTPTRKQNRTPDPVEGLFTDQPDTKPARKPRPPRWRDEDMPVRPGDVVALGLTHHRAVIGQATAVNDHCIRLNSYSPRLDRFTAGTVMVGWQQIAEFGPVARKRGDSSLVMDPLLSWAENWTIRPAN